MAHHGQRQKRPVRVPSDSRRQHRPASRHHPTSPLARAASAGSNYLAGVAQINTEFALLSRSIKHALPIGADDNTLVTYLRYPGPGQRTLRQADITKLAFLLRGDGIHCCQAVWTPMMKRASPAQAQTIRADFGLPRNPTGL